MLIVKLYIIILNILLVLSYVKLEVLVVYNPNGGCSGYITFQ
jgi:hypothetical protein